MEYSLTLADIQTYIDSLKDDDVVGILDSSACLGANALHHKYPDQYFYVCRDNLRFYLSGEKKDRYEEPPLIGGCMHFDNQEVTETLKRFDLVARGDIQVTKKDWMETNEKRNLLVPGSSAR